MKATKNVWFIQGERETERERERERGVGEVGSCTVKYTLIKLKAGSAAKILLFFADCS